MGERETFDATDVAEIEEPDVGEDLSFPDVASNDAAEDVDLDLYVGCGVDPGELWYRRCQCLATRRTLVKLNSRARRKVLTLQMPEAHHTSGAGLDRLHKR